MFKFMITSVVDPEFLGAQTPFCKFFPEICMKFQKLERGMRIPNAPPWIRHLFTLTTNTDILLVTWWSW